MDIHYIILLIGIIIILSYLFDQIGRILKVPSVILLLGAGIALQPIFRNLALEIPYIKVILPTLGTVALLLIVLEGALDLYISKEK